MQPYTPQDLTGDGAAHTLASLLGINRCRWFQVSGITSAGVATRVGGSNVALGTSSPAVSGSGFPITGGGSQFAPPVSLNNEVYDLEQWYIIIPSGDKVSVGCVV